MDQQYGEFVGVDNLYYALITEDSDSAYVAATPQYLAPVAEIAGAPTINNKTTYYDNKAANNYVTEGVTKITITVSNVPAQKMAILLGKKYDTATGRVLDTGEAIPPDVAIGFRYNMGKNGYRYYWYLKGTIAGGSEESATKTDDVDERTYELTYTAVTTTKEWLIDGENKSLKRVFADTADAAFNPAGWFTQVQTPDITSAPAALTLSSSVPVDGATDVAVSSAIVLTFNNAIENEAVALVNAATGDLVAVNKTFDATKKILTVAPTAALSNNTKYIVLLSGVVDAYGQQLPQTAIDFTTIA